MSTIEMLEEAYSTRNGIKQGYEDDEHCNTLLGTAFDSINILKAAIDYLRANGK